MWYRPITAAFNSEAVVSSVEYYRLMDNCALQVLITSRWGATSSLH